MIELLDEVEAFEARAGELLAATVCNTVLATIVHGIRSGAYAGEPPPRFAVVSDPTGAVTGAALRTPPRGLLCTELSDADAAQLIERWLDADPDVPTVNARTATARALAAAYRERIGGRTELETSIALHALAPAGLVTPPRPAAGELRAVAPDEHALVTDWFQAFVVESSEHQDAESARRSAESRLERGTVFVWDHAGEPVSLVGHTVQVAGVPRVGPVYTPPEHRGHGYASSAVAALSARLFGEGAREVVLFTDLANPTSNKIYADVGYRRIADYEQYLLAG